jgi:hypothetical protein
MKSSEAKPTSREDSARLSALEFFILAMVAKGGAETLYEFKRAGVSAGAASGPITSMIAEKWLVRSAGTDGGRRLKVTAAGAHMLELHWRRCLDEVPPDMGAALRTFWAACLMGEAITAEIYLSNVVWHRAKQRKGDRWAEVSDLEDEGKYLRNASEGYRWLRAYWSLRLAEQETWLCTELSRIIAFEPVIAGVRTPESQWRQLGESAVDSRAGSRGYKKGK